MMRSLISASAFFSLSALLGCTQQPATQSVAEEPPTSAVSTINEHCPIMGNDVAADGGTFEWNDQTVGFCCPGCIEKFESLSDEEKAAALAKAEESHGDHDHGDHDHGDHDHGEPEDGESADS